MPSNAEGPPASESGASATDRKDKRHSKDSKGKGQARSEALRDLLLRGLASSSGQEDAIDERRNRRSTPLPIETGEWPPKFQGDGTLDVADWERRKKERRR